MNTKKYLKSIVIIILILIIIFGYIIYGYLPRYSANLITSARLDIFNRGVYPVFLTQNNQTNYIEIGICSNEFLNLYQRMCQSQNG